MHAPVDQAHSPLRRYRAVLVLLCVSAPSFMLQLDANIVALCERVARTRKARS
jgi:hypothetical protein